MKNLLDDNLKYLIGAFLFLLIIAFIFKAKVIFILSFLVGFLNLVHIGYNLILSLKAREKEIYEPEDQLDTVAPKNEETK
jgi:hypothetical protein